MNDEQFLPDPLTPADCDLRDFQFMPLDVGRLRDSKLASHVPPTQCWFAVILWCASWHQIPAASLPDDDIELARLAGFGFVVKEWKKVRAGALYGWVKCSDGRLYHPVVAEKARDAWQAKHEQRWKSECARIKKHNQRHGTGIPYPTLDEFLSPDYIDPTKGDKPHPSLGTKKVSPEFVPGTLDPRDREGRGKGQGEGNKDIGTSIVGSTSDPREHPNPPRHPDDWVSYFRDRHGVEIDVSSIHDRKKAWPIFTAWCAAGLTLEQVDAAVAQARKQAKQAIAFLPSYVDRVLSSQAQGVGGHDNDAENERAAKLLFGGETPTEITHG